MEVSARELILTAVRNGGLRIPPKARAAMESVGIDMNDVFRIFRNGDVHEDFSDPLSSFRRFEAVGELIDQPRRLLAIKLIARPDGGVPIVDVTELRRERAGMLIPRGNPRTALYEVPSK